MAGHPDDVALRGYRGRADARGIARVNAAAWRAAYADLLPEGIVAGVSGGVDDEAAIRARHRDLAAVREGVHVAAAGERVVGYAVFRWGGDAKPFVGADEAGLKELYVHPDRWGEGIGTALLDRGIAALPEGLEALVLETLAGNDAGRGFYEARGFERAGETSFEIAGEELPTVVYRREL